ncbi:hypothetical protein FA15DRAFT_670731 [Coprinopsis marcescibilis]|uniref:Uncharacterized protein n=1 Tax=Coprinopsis marcescibilis TaxID=230819 RepID=A0A5C3KRV6_COPMA|nr:hypothetical protein FA15DRAFT_670731 [Coprinopsis marcescibilis]
MARKRQILKVVAVLGAFLYVAFWLRRLQSEEIIFTQLLREYRPKNADPFLQPRIPRDLCIEDECLHGRWVRRDPPFTSLQDFQAVFTSNSSTKWHRCAVVPPAEGVTRTPDETKKLEQERLVETMNWVWMPDRGRMVPFDVEDFIVRLLRTPAGVIFIGDSLSAAHRHGFQARLEQGGFKFDVASPSYSAEFVPFSNASHLRMHILRPNDPMTLKLQRRAQDHMLIHEPEIRAITEQYGAKKTYYWYHKFKRVEGWESFVRLIARPRAGEEHVVTGNTILLMNAGAHWSRSELAMLPDRGTDEQEQLRVIWSYQQMVKLLMNRLSPIPRISVLYRSTSPGHPNCGSKPSPYDNITHALAGEHNVVQQLLAPLKTSKDIKSKKRWDWNLFNEHNMVWKREIEKLKAEEEENAQAASAETRARWDYVDLWEMNLQRPDAHSEPGKDCLHWCLPVVHADWTHYLYHLVYLRTAYASI